jgi:hypothetical protein
MGCPMLVRHDPEQLRVSIDDARHYVGGEIGSVPYVSVTTVLARTSDMESSYAFKTWRRNLEAIEPGLADLARDVAAARGSKLDAEMTQHLIARTLPGPDADVWLRSVAPVLAQWRTLATVGLAQGCVWHGIDRVAGTVDFVLRIAGGWWLFDAKTSLRPWDQARIAIARAQLGAYAECFRWTYDEEIAGCGFVVALADQPAQVRLVPPDEAVAAWHERRALYRELTAPRAMP